jgi:hypothetical protein
MDSRNRMQLPNWFKVVWWVGLSGVVSAYLIARYPDLVTGRAALADIIVFLVWVALLVVPIFQEVELFGLRFKQEIHTLKEELKTEIHSVRAELRNAVDVRTTFSPQITIPAAPPDSQLPDLETRVKAAVAEALAAHGVRQPVPVPADLAVADDISFLFAARYGIERELRRLARERQLEVGVRHVGGMQLSRTLVQAGVIDPPLDHAIREVYAVSSAGVHAEDVTDAQVGFVRDVSPQLIGALRAIRRAVV